MKTSSLNKTRTIWTLVQAFDLPNAGALFEWYGSDQHRYTLTLEYPDWDDMGRPHEITVTIEPGDHLNA